MNEYKEFEYVFELEEAYETGLFHVYESYIDNDFIRLKNPKKREYDPLSENILEAIVGLVDTDCINTLHHGLSTSKILSFTNKYGLLFPDVAAKRHPQKGRHAIQPHPDWLNEIDESIQNFRKNAINLWQLVSMYEDHSPFIEGKYIRMFGAAASYSDFDLLLFFGVKLLRNENIRLQADQQVVSGHVSLSDVDEKTPTSEIAVRYIIHRINAHLEKGGVYPALKKSGGLKLTYHLETLLDVAYIQLAHLITGQSEVLRCRECGGLMVNSKGYRKNKEAHTNCRIRKNMRNMRKRKREQEKGGKKWQQSQKK